MRVNYLIYTNFFLTRTFEKRNDGVAMNRLLIVLSWPEAYQYDSLKADILAGLTVALVLIPQSLAYAELAGLPPYYGLYAAFLPPLVAALFGSSRQLATDLACLPGDAVVFIDVPQEELVRRSLARQWCRGGRCVSSCPCSGHC